MWRPLFTVPVLVATCLLVLHSWLFRGRRSTLVFWGLGYLVAFARELVYQNVFPTYRFTQTDLQLLHVPLTIPAGWLFEAYISLTLAQFILGTDRASILAGEARITPRRYGTHVLPVLALACVVTSTISFAIENVAVRMHWWQPRGGGSHISPGWMPGHMFTVFWMLTLLLYVTHPALRLRRNLLYVGLALGFTSVVELIEPIARAARDHAWAIPAVAIVISVCFFASLFLWRRLVLWFFVVFVLGVMGDVPASWIAAALGLARRGEMANVWSAWVMTVMMAYGAYLLVAQKPEVRTRPTVLL